jgi:hypothetical protein
MNIRCECASRGQVVTERLLDDHAGVFGQPRVGQSLDHRREQERWNLQVEDRSLRGADRLGHLLVRAGISKVTLHVGKPSRQPGEDLVVDRFPGAFDALTRVLTEVINRPIVHRHAQDGAVQQPAFL